MKCEFYLSGLPVEAFPNRPSERISRRVFFRRFCPSGHEPSAAGLRRADRPTWSGKATSAFGAGIQRALQLSIELLPANRFVHPDTTHREVPRQWNLLPSVNRCLSPNQLSCTFYCTVRRYKRAKSNAAHLGLPLLVARVPLTGYSAHEPPCLDLKKVAPKIVLVALLTVRRVA